MKKPAATDALELEIKNHYFMDYYKREKAQLSWPERLAVTVSGLFTSALNDYNRSSLPDGKDPAGFFTGSVVVFLMVPIAILTKFGLGEAAFFYGSAVTGLGVSGKFAYNSLHKKVVAALDADAPELVQRYVTEVHQPRQKNKMQQARKLYQEQSAAAENRYQQTLSDHAQRNALVESLCDKFAAAQQEKREILVTLSNLSKGPSSVTRKTP